MTATVPETRAEPVVERLHGEEIADPYRWLEDDESAATRAWTAAQNAYTAGVLDRLPGRDALRERLAGLLQVGFAQSAVRAATASSSSSARGGRISRSFTCRMAGGRMRGSCSTRTG